MDPSARLNAHRRDPKKVDRGGYFTLQPVFVGLNLATAKIFEQGLMEALKPYMLINEIRAIARWRVGPQHFVQAVLTHLGNVAENEWLYWLRK